MIKVALICGTGASSSFMAVKLRAAVKEKGLHIEVSVCPETALTKEIETYDHILIGPHLSFLEEELPSRYQLKGKLAVIPYYIYATMDGCQLLKLMTDSQ